MLNGCPFDELFDDLCGRICENASRKLQNLNTSARKKRKLVANIGYESCLEPIVRLEDLVWDDEALVGFSFVSLFVENICSRQVHDDPGHAENVTKSADFQPKFGLQQKSVLLLILGELAGSELKHTSCRSQRSDCSGKLSAAHAYFHPTYFLPSASLHFNTERIARTLDSGLNFLVENEFQSFQKETHLLHLLQLQWLQEKREGMKRGSRSASHHGPPDSPPRVRNVDLATGRWLVGVSDTSKQNYLKNVFSTG